MFNPYDVMTKWMMFWGLIDFGDCWAAACDRLPIVGNAGIAGLPAGFCGC